MREVCQLTNDLIDSYLKRKDIYKKDASWKIEKSELGGRGVFATRNIAVGEIIFADYPVIKGPRAIDEYSCVCCFGRKNLHSCSKECGLLVCSQNCEHSEIHKKECQLISKWKTADSNISELLMKCVSPIRGLFLTDNDIDLVKCLAAHMHPQHGYEVELLKNEIKLSFNEEEAFLMKAVCAVLDANAFEVLTVDGEIPTLRGLYPLSSMMNHNCVPNAMHVFDESQHMIVKAAMPIAAGQEICGSYTRVTWGTLGRHTHLLKTKHFSCRCSRCQDPTEFGTNLNAILCSKCQGLMLPASHSKLQWKCNTCDETMPASKIAFISNVLAGRTASIDQDVEEMLRFRREKLLSVLPDCNQVSLELKYRIIWILGFDHGYTFPELSLELLDTKEQFCRDVLDVVKRLGLGMCKIRGLVEYELYKCLRERYRRYPEIELENSMNELIEDAAKIFKYDLSAPKEVLEIWNKTDECCDWREAYFGDVKCI